MASMNMPVFYDVDLFRGQPWRQHTTSGILIETCIDEMFFYDQQQRIGFKGLAFRRS